MIRSRPGLRAAFTGMGCVCVLLTCCATSRTVDGVYVDEAKGFRVQLPRHGWHVVESSGADLTLRDTGSQARMAVSASCPARETGPLPALARHLLFGLRDVKRMRQEPILIDGVEGLDTEVIGTWEGERVQVWSVVIRRGGCLYDLLFIAPPATFGAQRADFDALLNSWEFLSETP
ncbi:MAG: hypothetical protein ACE5MG_03650 [Candidatus Methylomirabilales bacterium]